MRQYVCVILGLSLWAAIPARAAPKPPPAVALARLEIGSLAPDFALQGSDGRMHHLSDYRGSIVVLEWTSPVCPYTLAKYDTGQMQSAQQFAHAHQVVWLSIDTANASKPGYLTPAAAAERVGKTHALVDAFLFDVEGNVGRSFGARTTPGMYVVDSAGRLAYQGSFDDAPSNEHPITHEYVRAAIDALSAGRPIETAETVPHGCAVEY